MRGADGIHSVETRRPPNGRTRASDADARATPDRQRCSYSLKPPRGSRCSRLRMRRNSMTSRYVCAMRSVVFVSAAGGARELWFLRILCASGLRGHGHVGVRESFVTAVCRTGIPAIARFGGTVERFVRRRRIESIAGKKEKRARARIERARTALCRSIGFGTRRLGFVRGVDVSRNVLLFD
jgi:hypothetical protein